MEELIKKLVENAGLTEEQAKKAVETILEHVKGNLPAGLSDKVEEIINGKFDMNSLLGGGFSSALGSLKNMFGGK